MITYKLETRGGKIAGNNNVESIFRRNDSIFIFTIGGITAETRIDLV